MTPYFRKMVWVPTFLALGSLLMILGNAVRARAWQLLAMESCLALLILAAIVWMLRSVRSGEPGQHSGQEAMILFLLLVVVATGAAQILWRR